MAYFTQSVVKPRGYYTSLHSRSSADMYDHRGVSNSLPTPLRGDEPDVYEVDRLIAERKTKVITATPPIRLSEGALSYTG